MDKHRLDKIITEETAKVLNELKLKNKKGVNLTMAQAFSTDKIDKAIYAHIKQNYPDDYNPGVSRYHGGKLPVGMLGKQGHGLKTTNIMAIHKFAKKNNDTALLKLIDNWVKTARANDLIESINEDLPTKEIDPKQFPNPLPGNVKGFLKKGDSTSDGGPQNDDVVPTKPVEIAVSKLKPSQDAIYLGKSLAMAINGVEGGDLGAVISKDNYILDGHHRYAATSFNNPSATVGGVQAQLEIGDLIPVLRAAGDAMKNKRGVEPKGGDVNIFKATMNDVKAIVYEGKNVPAEYYNKEKAVAWFEGIGEATIAKRLKMIQAKRPPAGAPPRKDMPKIKPDQVNIIKTLLNKGKIDVRPPYANESVEEGIFSKSKKGSELDAKITNYLKTKYIDPETGKNLAFKKIDKITPHLNMYFIDYTDPKGKKQNVTLTHHDMRNESISPETLNRIINEEVDRFVGKLTEKSVKEALTKDDIIHKVIQHALLDPKSGQNKASADGLLYYIKKAGVKDISKGDIITHAKKMAGIKVQGGNLIADVSEDINEAKMTASKMVKIFKNRADWGDFGDQVYVKGGNLVVVDTFYYGERQAMQDLIKKWSPGGWDHDYFRKTYGIDIKIVDSFSEFKATGRHKKISPDGIVGVVLQISGGQDTPLTESKQLNEDLSVKDFDEYNNYIEITLSNGRKLKIQQKRIPGGKKMYQAILQGLDLYNSNPKAKRFIDSLVTRMAADLGD